MNIRDILLIIIIIYLIISHSKKKNMEKFAVTDDIKAAVKEVYNTDMESVRQLATMAKQLSEGGMRIPGNLTVDGTITNTGSISTSGNLSGNNITSNNNVFNLLPRGIILSYYSTSPPSGWVLCDGQNSTPNLKGKFILGYGNGYEYGLTNRNINETGGTETHTLSVNEIPAHSHKITARYNPNNGGGDIFFREGWSYGGLIDLGNQVKIHDTGGGAAHNNMPPYYVLTYIMKI